MQLTVVGSADAFNAEGRAHSCYLIDGDDVGPTMVDFGATALASLHRLGKKSSDLRSVVFTHLHGDHIGGSPFLFIDSLFVDPRSAPLRLIGPPGLEARLRALLDVTYGRDILGRGHPLELVFEEIAPGRTLHVDGLAVTAYPADHQDPPEVPLCLRFARPGGGKIAFSGDTQMCEGLLTAARDVDLLVAECSSLAPPAGRHCTWQDWLQVFPELSARRVLLTHLGRDVRRAIPRLLAAPPPGPRLDFADDGLVVEVLPEPSVGA